MFAVLRCLQQGSNEMREYQLLGALAVSLCGITMARGEDTSNVTIELMAADSSWVNSEFVGHAFLCIGVQTQSGIKEECFGFYPHDGKAIIGGPGTVVSEFARNPSRFSNVVVSVKKNISNDQRRHLYKVIKEWNSKNYDLTNQNCIDFVVAAAAAMGWNVPPHGSTDFPKTYLKKLKDKNP
jgi:hypothetical protein